ncbi:MAG: DnaA regulatory inactivator Hda [Steroidobacteraceae bacterium]|jgi:DnaA family protein|nr:DnaA regulatory inactivator Hda [Steroidobacteraceae bacterium]
MEQLPLGVRLRASATLASFHAGANAPLLAALEARSCDGGLPPLWIWSAPGAGRTHLLQAACARAGDLRRASAYLPLAESWLEPAMLAGLEGLQLVCLDDLDAVAGRDGWERALFVLHNELAERGGNLVIAAGAAPAAVPLRLPDLASRLAAAVVWNLKSLGDEDHAPALQARAQALGLELPDDTLQWLTRRLPRDYAALCEVLDRLDRAALARQRRLTVPFVRSVLEAPAG